MAIIHQSMITSWSRCPAAFGYEQAGAPQRQSSALAYGSVIHFALLEVFERVRHLDGVSIDDAVQQAIDSFEFYWNPLNIEAICAPVDHWLPGQTRTDLLMRGEGDIRWYAEQVATRQATLSETVLATEYSFQVPIEGTFDEETGQPHILVGTIDRLGTVFERKICVLEVGDVKSGKDYTGLRQNLQFSAYSYATTRPEFWYGWNGEDGFGDMADDLYARLGNLDTVPRRGRWISTKSRKWMDAGWRGPHDFRRFALAVEQIIASQKADIYPLNISGETCTYCQFRDSCAGVGVPDDDHGAHPLLVGLSTPSARMTGRRK